MRITVLLMHPLPIFKYSLILSYARLIKLELVISTSRYALEPFPYLNEAKLRTY